MSDDRPPFLARLWRACLLILGSAFCVWLAVQLLAQVWVVVAICIAVTAIIASLIWWLRTRGTRW